MKTLFKILISVLPLALGACSGGGSSPATLNMTGSCPTGQVLVGLGCCTPATGTSCATANTGAIADQLTSGAGALNGGNGNLGNANLMVGTSGVPSGVKSANGATQQAATAALITTPSALGNGATGISTLPSLAAPLSGASSGGSTSGGMGAGGGGGGGLLSTNLTSPAASPSPDSMGATAASQSGVYTSGGGVLPSGVMSEGAGGFGSGLGAGGGTTGGGAEERTIASTLDGDGKPISAMGTPDPEDYFTRLDLTDSLFKTVEKRYRSQTANWN